jgi:alkanesulfonate monooxygenase SsuD/methylene tetrahydromethanopterin reductase-like flavin-dependent oxidoreductase (luciferase family)
MRFTLMTGLGGIEDYPDLAREAEACGYHSLAVPDSLFYPPYLSTETVRQALDGVPVLEPFIAMAGMAAVTTSLRFYPAVLKVPDRIALGAGLSPWKEDFSYNGVDFDLRGKLMDECLEIIRGAMSGEYFEYHSDNYDIGRMKLSPVPGTSVPVLVGGHAKPALRRAARLGDGWISANSDYEALRGMIATLNELRIEYGTDGNSEFEIHAFDMAATEPDDFRRLADLGVTDACVTPWNPYDPGLDREQKLAAIREFADRVIHSP